TVKVGGKTLKAGTDYAVSYKSNKAVGTATVTVTGKGAYTGSKSATFKINPKGTSVKGKVAAGKKSFTVKWSKLSKANLKQATGYQIRYSLKKTMKGAKVKTVKATSSAGKKCALKVSKLKGGKKYYVQVRTYKKVGGKTYCSGWSKAKTVKVKK
ncbi:MAG: fibronectin type III domain-containing protein, partial [Adlercreutzia sp.]|nr:fibronectin type III domain-containing protein [Adlercreutzia sp.]